MRLARLALLLVVSVPSCADSFFPMVLARHRPMHPDDAQAVTFEATATANRVTLSYVRYDLGTAPDGSHVYTPAESETVKVCDPRGTLSKIVCIHRMPAPFPPRSLITFTATAVYADGFEAREAYSFAAGEWPWPREPIPIRLKGLPVSKLDTVFVLADDNVTMERFRDQLADQIEKYFKYAPILFWRGMHNFYYSAMRGSYGPAECRWTLTPNDAELRVIADALAYMHATGVRNCANIPYISAALGHATVTEDKGLVHESAHAWYRVQDEYCCNTRYAPQPCEPNIYGSLAACEADAQRLGYTAANCIRIGTNDVWRIDPSTEPACIMGPNQNTAASLFRAACHRRMVWRYRKCLAGECMSDPQCR